MKKKMLLLACLMTSCVALLAQVKKPTLMVFPSDSYCTVCGYIYQVETADGLQTMPDYTRCVTEDQMMMSAISIMNKMLIERNVQVKDLAHTIKMMAGKEAEEGTTSTKPLYDKILKTADVDIVIMIDIRIEGDKIRRNITVDITGITADTGDIIASSIKTNRAAIGQTDSELVYECMLGGIDFFFDDISNYFISKAQQTSR